MREKGCQYLSKLEGKRLERIHLWNKDSGVYEGADNRVGAWGKRCLETRAKEVKVDAYQLK